MVFASFTVFAWTGPTAAPPGNNVSAPVNVGTVDQIKEAGLGLDALAVFGNAIISTVSGYLNFGDGAGSSGYGFRDNAGTMEFKNSAGSWSSFLPSTNVESITFVDGTTQTTAAGVGGIATATTASCTQSCSTPGCTASCTVTCPASYYRTGCSSSTAAAAQPSGNAGCNCRTSGIGSNVVCYAYCAK